MSTAIGRPWIRRILLGLTLLASAWAGAQESQDPRAADRAQLRGLLYSVEGAFNARDVAALESLMVDEPGIYWLDGRHTATKAEIRAHHQRMFGAAEAPIKEMRLSAHLGAPAQFYGDAALAFGTTSEHYVLRRGGRVDLEGRWTAVCVKQSGIWRIASLHFSIDPFENPILGKAKRLAWILGLAGLALGILATYLFLRRRG